MDMALPPYPAAAGAGLPWDRPPVDDGAHGSLWVSMGGRSHDPWLTAHKRKARGLLRLAFASPPTREEKGFTTTPAGSSVWVI